MLKNYLNLVHRSNLGDNRMPDKTQQQQQKTKELKVFSAQVITLDQIRNDSRKLRLLFAISTLKEVSEKGLAYMVQYLKEERKIDMGYNIVKLGNKLIVRELPDDIKALLYVGLIEVDPKTKKLRLTSNGQEFLEKISKNEDIDNFIKVVDELRSKIVVIDEEVSLTALPTERKRR